MLLNALVGWRSTLALGRACFSPVRIAIVGAPNAGKSTLLNALARRKRAVVHEEPGTTRDSIEEPGAVEGVPVVWIDTAGFGAPRGPIDAEAQSAGREAARRADLVLVLCEQGALHADASPRRRSRAAPQADGAALVADGDDSWSRFAATHLAGSPVSWIPVLTKGDLLRDMMPSGDPPSPSSPLRVAALSGAGLDTLRGAVLAALGITGDGRVFPPRPDSPVCWNERQAGALDDCLQAVADAARIPTPRRARSALIRALDRLDRRIRWRR